MNQYLWYRKGDAASYEKLDDLDELDIEFEFETGDRFGGWVDGAIGYGFRVSPLWMGFNFISLYWGDEEGSFIRMLNRSERVAVVEEFSGAYPSTTGIAVAWQPPHRNCDEDRFNRAVDRAEHLERLGAENIIVYYDPHWDFMIVQCDLNGHCYEIRSYKIHAVDIDGVAGWQSFNTEFRLFQFFESLI